MSAQTMKFLVYLAKAKEKKRIQIEMKEAELYSKSPTAKSGLARGKTLQNVRQFETPEEKVARRMSHQVADGQASPSVASVGSEGHGPPSRKGTHIRSYSEPKDHLEEITSMKLDAPPSENDDDDSKHDPENENPNLNDRESGNAPENDSLTSLPETLKADLPQHHHKDNSATNSMDGSVGSEDDSYVDKSHNSLQSQSVSYTITKTNTHTRTNTNTQTHTHTHTQTDSMMSQDMMGGRQDKSFMTVASMTETIPTEYSQTQSIPSQSITMSNTHVSQASNNLSLNSSNSNNALNAPPRLETLSERSASNRSTGDIDMESKILQQPRSQGNDKHLDYQNERSNDVPTIDISAPPSLALPSDSEDNGGDLSPNKSAKATSLEMVDENRQLDTVNKAKKPNEFVEVELDSMSNPNNMSNTDLNNDNNTINILNNNNNNTDINSTNDDGNNNDSGGLFSFLCCCCGGDNPNLSNNDSQHLKHTQTQSRSEENSTMKSERLKNGGTQDPLTLHQSNNTQTSSDGGYGSSLALDGGGDWRSVTTASRLRRPTQYSTQTKNEESTIDPNDVRLWDEPFGKGASARVFKAVYLPLCQVLAVKVVSRLDGQNVKQVLGEFRDQQELLPDCDRLMRIWGWYRDLEKNDVVIALEYMDMGSVYDSCFPKERERQGDSALNITAEEQEKSGHKQITVDKITYDQVRYIARESLVGLHALHNCEPSLIHRDIKPHNILLSSYGEVKIADFGLLKRLNKDGVLTDSKGTEKYFSPERIQKKYGTGSDIWALGITLIEIYNQELIPRASLDWFKIENNGIDINEFIPSTAPTEFVDFLKKCLAKDPQQRQNATELLKHKFVTRKWGDVFEPNLERKKPVQFADLKSDQKTLDKLIHWLQEWILFDDQKNAKLFEEGDDTYLRECVFNLARCTGYGPQYIDKYVAEVYREHVNTKPRV